MVNITEGRETDDVQTMDVASCRIVYWRGDIAKLYVVRRSRETCILSTLLASHVYQELFYLLPFESTELRMISY